MNKTADVGFVCGNYREIDETGSTTLVRPFATLRRKPEILSGKDFVQFCGARDLVATPTAVVRTRLQHELGGYRSDLPHTADMEMWLRFAAHTSIGIVHTYQAVRRLHSANMSRAYAVNNSLPDLLQRKAAIDCLFMHPSVATWDSSFRRRMSYLLSRDAVGCASAAFNEGKLAVCNQLLECATALNRDIRGSWTWKKLAFKRLIGIPAWGVLQDAFGAPWNRGRRLGSHIQSKLTGTAPSGSA
jgi:hypothetical protein